jgi:ATP-binding cassette subfamily B protein
MTPMKWVFSFLKKYRVKLIIAFVLVTISTIMFIVNPYVSGLIVDRVIEGGEHSLLPKLIAIMFTVACYNKILVSTTKIVLVN